MKINTGTVTQYQDIDAQQTRQNVPWNITDDDGTPLFAGNQSFSLEASADEIRAFLAQNLATHKEDAARYEASKEAQAALENAGLVAGEISNITVTE